MKKTRRDRISGELQQAMAKNTVRLRLEKSDRLAEELLEKQAAKERRYETQERRVIKAKEKQDQIDSRKERLRRFRQEQPGFLLDAKNVGIWLRDNDAEPDVKIPFGSTLRHPFPIVGWILASTATQSLGLSERTYHPAKSEDNLGLYYREQIIEHFERSVVLSRGGAVYITEGRSAGTTSLDSSLGWSRNPMLIHENTHPKWLASVFHGDDLSIGRQALLNVIENATALNKK